MTRCARLIIALDDPRLASALAMARRLRGVVRTVKVGSALFTAAGPAAIQRLRAMGFSVMLDLKFFDIPNTVELSCRAAARHRAAMVTVHAQGGRRMLEAAVRGAREEARRLRRAPPLVLGVTVLTSLSTAPGRATRTVLQLAQEAKRAGCDGVVASAQEAAAVRRRFGHGFLIVCPGIRLERARDDQRRVSTPADAVAQGADALVVGRPVTAAGRPRQAVRAILQAMEASNAC